MATATRGDRAGFGLGPFGERCPSSTLGDPEPILGNRWLAAGVGVMRFGTAGGDFGDGGTFGVAGWRGERPLVRREDCSLRRSSGLI